MDSMMTPAIVVMAGAYVGYVCLRKLAKTGARRNGCTGGCSGCGCNHSYGDDQKQITD
jgi:hypothetical protein